MLTSKFWKRFQRVVSVLIVLVLIGGVAFAFSFDNFKRDLYLIATGLVVLNLYIMLRLSSSNNKRLNKARQRNIFNLSDEQKQSVRREADK